MFRLPGYVQVDKSKQAYPSYLGSKPAKQNSVSFHVISPEESKLGDAEAHPILLSIPLVAMTLGHGNPGHSAAPVQGAGPGLCCIASVGTSYSAQAGCRLDNSGWPGGR
ncbi:hypothetical protein NEUTE1DRAFT_106514 [Neurospora tetrasperma FGSC 2508]|uniref:Uncharacterized protein n=1 Tax=Neurospora tetrasperma (strain FGSC 2508 / ATCC MYA-4615 / P0657) TaxID=510951 RepID=F8N540_NEUT8|nr:uncharacterized protein NEUTE1DRAFT_106514 [Neurospora tetrasperma FGSC 2508]EGO53621.1 hypothetical protein NEUTE1DRAFT_106514 [Neurospora tetrasperma FGSC 2508]